MTKVYTGTGRRKSSIAQVRMVPGKGKITVNGRDVREFFPYETNVMGTVHVLECVRITSSVRSFVNVTTDKVYLNKEWLWGYNK